MGRIMSKKSGIILVTNVEGGGNYVGWELLTMIVENRQLRGNDGSEATRATVGGLTKTREVICNVGGREEVGRVNDQLRV